MTTKYIGRSWPDAHEIMRMGDYSRTMLMHELDEAEKECRYFDFGNPEVMEFVPQSSPLMEQVWMTELQIDRVRELLASIPCPPED